MKALFAIIFCALLASAVAQVPAKKEDKLKGSLLQLTHRAAVQRDAVDSIFGRLEKHIAEGAARPLVGFIGQQVFIDVSGSAQGYYSSNQALSMIESYFAQRKPLSFTFSSVNQRAPSPYATGRLTYQYKGNRESAQVYVALTKRDSLWQMTQFNIY
ncbi:MAG TPA: DUF4783 domain-containing protein [Bacteroidota bacterium]